MKISFGHAVLFFLAIIVGWLVFEIDQLIPTNKVYIPNQESGYAVIETKHGMFPITIDQTKRVTDGTKISFIIINPLYVHFSEAEILIHVHGVMEKVTTNLLPGANLVKAKIKPVDIGDTLEVELYLNKIYFK